MPKSCKFVVQKGVRVKTVTESDVAEINLGLFRLEES